MPDAQAQSKSQERVPAEIFSLSKCPCMIKLLDETEDIDPITNKKRINPSILVHFNRLLPDGKVAYLVVSDQEAVKRAKHRNGVTPEKFWELIQNTRFFKAGWIQPDWEFKERANEIKEIEENSAKAKKDAVERLNVKYAKRGV